MQAIDQKWIHTNSKGGIHNGEYFAVQLTNKNHRMIHLSVLAYFKTLNMSMLRLRPIFDMKIKLWEWNFNVLLFKFFIYFDKQRVA